MKNSQIIIISKPQPIAVVIPRNKPQTAVAQQILRGQRGATDITPIAPLELNSDDELTLGSFTFTQTVNLATWIINHNLKKPCPFIMVNDEFGETIIGDVRCIDDNNLEIRFNQPTLGTAFLI